MKKFFAILVLLMYGFSSTGMTISLHYCCGKLKSIDWALPKHKSCDDKPNMGGKPCCETKLISNKDKSDQDTSQFVLKPAPTDFIEPKFFTEIPNLAFNNRQLTPEVFAPPPPCSVPLYISHQVFRI
jgi:hypothetical protein